MITVARHGDYRRTFLRMLAFLCRYGHQDLESLLRQPMTLIVELTEEVGSIMQQEKAQWSSAFEGGD